MIYLEMYGRLGNQMFRYAAARAAQMLYYPDEKICINWQQVDDAGERDATFYRALDDFQIVPCLSYSKGGKVILNESSLSQKAISIPYYLGLRRFKPEQMNEMLEYQKKWERLLAWGGVFWYRTGYCPLRHSRMRNKFLSGGFESTKYFDAIRPQLLEEFTPKHARLEKNQSLYEAIENTNSVGISVRRGDYESNGDIRKLHSVCHADYYAHAIEEIKKRVDNPVFFLFSDDIEWAKTHINTGGETYCEDGTDPVWEKLRMQSLCRHHIISNSTFSWWGQWLCANENKIVASPGRWFNNDYESPLINRERWVLVEV